MYFRTRNRRISLSKPRRIKKPQIKSLKKKFDLNPAKTLRTEIETWKKQDKSLPFRSSISPHHSSGSPNQRFEQRNSGSGPEKRKKSKTQKIAKATDNGNFSFKPKLVSQKQMALGLKRRTYQNQTEQKKPLYAPGLRKSSHPLPSFVQQKLPPGVRLGNITALNTDEHRYYSFIQRLLSKFLPLWAERVSKAVYQWARENNSPGISKAWLTQVEVIMDEKGEIMEVQPFRLSGRWSIDSATVESFKKIGTVPNPSKEMIDENGYIHLQFQTEVLWVPQPHRQFQGRQ